jgi:hypothetical protein
MPGLKDLDPPKLRVNRDSAAWGVIASDRPWDHPGFAYPDSYPDYDPDDPEPDAATLAALAAAREAHQNRERAVVYVPILAGILLWSGGPGPWQQGFGVFDHDHDIRFGPVTMRVFRRDGDWLVEVMGFHPTEPDLFVWFILPEKWHLGDWTVDSAICVDRSSSSTDLDALVARYADHRVGAIIAESRHPRRDRPSSAPRPPAAGDGPDAGCVPLEPTD